MESRSDNGSSVNMRTGPSTNSGEREQFNSEKKLGPSFSPFTSELTSQDHIQLLPNATTTTTTPPSPSATTSPLTNNQIYLQSKSHPTSSEDGSSINSHLEAHHANPFGEAFPSSLGKNLSQSSSSSSQNLFLLPSDATNTTHVGASEAKEVHDQVPFELGLHQPSSIMQQKNEDITDNSLSTYPVGSLGETRHSSSTDDMHGLHSLFTPTTYESSPGCPFQVPTSTSIENPIGEAGSQKVVEHHDHDHDLALLDMKQEDWSLPSHEARTQHHPANTYGETHAPTPSSSQQLDPLFTLESTQNQNINDATDKNHKSDNVPTNVGTHHDTFQVPTSTSIENPIGEASSQKVVEHHGHDHDLALLDMKQEDWSLPSHETRTQHHPANTYGETHAPTPSSSQQLDPLFTLELTQNQNINDATDKNLKSDNTPTNVETHHDTFSIREQGDNSMASRNLGIDTAAVVSEVSASSPGEKLGSSVSSSSSPTSKSSTQDPSHNSVNASSNTLEDTNALQKLGKNSHLASESSDDDIPISSMPKHGQQSSDISPGVVVVPETNKGLETQNPPIQVMERPEDPATSSPQRVPLDALARSNSNTHWSTASNESLFSIHMGNTSFSNDMALLSKSGDLDKPGDNDMNVSGGGFQGNQSPLPTPPPASKFNDISQSTAEQHDASKVTEEKAVETMRQVIMESSVATENKSKGDLTFAKGATPPNRHSNSNDHSHCSDGSTKSFAFKILSGGEKTHSSKRVEEKRMQQKQSEQQPLKETPTAAENPKSTTPNASHNKCWRLSCFTCCH